MRLCENEKVREYITRKNIEILNPDLSEEKREEMLDNFMKDTKRLNLHKRALAIKDKVEKQTKTLSDLKAEYKTITGKELELNTFSRMAFIEMDISGTPEAKKKNMEYLISLTDPNYARKQTARVINLVRNFDASKAVFNTVEEALALTEENYKEFYYMYCFYDLTHNLKDEFGTLTDDYIKDKIGQIQQANIATRNVDYLASNVYITMPDGNEVEALSNMNKISSTYANFGEVIDNIDKNKDSKEDKISCSALASRIELLELNKSIENQPKLIADGVIPKDICFYNCTINNENATISKGVEALNNNKEGVDFQKIPEDVLVKIDNELNNPKEITLTDEAKAENLIKEYNAKKAVDKAHKVMVEVNSTNLDDERQADEILKDLLKPEAAYLRRKDLRTQLKEFNNKLGLSSNIYEEINNIYEAAMNDKNTVEGKADFASTYKKSFSSAFRKIYKDIVINTAKKANIELNSTNVFDNTSADNIKETVITALEDLDNLMMNYTKSTLDNNHSKNKIIFNKKDWILAGFEPNDLLSSTETFIWGENAIKSYKDFFVNPNSKGLTGTAKYIADGNYIFNQVNAIKPNILSHEKYVDATPEEKELDLQRKLAIGKLEKDAAAIYAIMRKKHNDHKFWWRWFKGGESRSQLKAFKAQYCTTFGVNINNATDHILKVANGNSEVGIAHSRVIELMKKDNDLVKYHNKALFGLDSIIENKDLVYDMDEKEPFSLDIDDIKKVNELEDITNEDIPDLNM